MQTKAVGKNRNATKRKDTFDLGFGYCPKDGSKLECIDSRRSKTHTRRRWKCPKCGERNSTHEIPVEEHFRLLTVNANDADTVRKRVLEALEQV